MTALKFIEDRDGNLVDIDYFCNFCATIEGLDRWPCPSWPDYTVKCKRCDEVLREVTA